MNLQELARQATGEINQFRKNPVIFDFVREQALIKVADDINKEMGEEMVAPTDVSRLVNEYKNIKNRLEERINAALLGCWFVKHGIDFNHTL